MEIRNMGNIKERIRKQYGKGPKREIGAKGRRKARDRELVKYYSHKETAGSSKNLKRYERFFAGEGKAAGGGDEYK
jgi:hypothetical protein